jgi:hypothetical protein
MMGLMLLLAGLLGGVQAHGEPGFMRVNRRLQMQMADACAGALEKEIGKSVDEVAACVATCMDEVGPD